MNEYILIVSDTEQADLLALLKKFSSVTLKRLADTPVSPEIQAFLDATRQGLKEVELYEKGLINLKTGHQFLEELRQEIENEHYAV